VVVLASLAKQSTLSQHSIFSLKVQPACYKLMGAQAAVL
jgi:hypothetical protein